MTPLAVTGLGVVSPLGVGRETFVAAHSNLDRAASEGIRGRSEVLDAERFTGTTTAEVWGWDPKRWLGQKGHRSFDRLTKFLIAAGTLALDDAGIKTDGEFRAYGPERVGVSSATAYGSLDAITELKTVSELEDPRYINPTRFPNTVINAAAGYVSIWADLRAPNTTIVDGNCGSLDAVLNCETHLRHDRGDAFLVGGGEILSEALYLAMQKLGLLQDEDHSGLTMGEGACYLVVERPDKAKARGARLLGEIIGYGTSFEPPTSAALLVSASANAIERSMRMALREAAVYASEVDMVCTARSGLEETDDPETVAIDAVFGKSIAVAAPKALTGETFGAGGAFAMAHALAAFEHDRASCAMVNAVGYYGNVSSVLMRAAKP